MRRLPFVIFLLAVLSVGEPSLSQNYIRSARLGITFISSPDHFANELRYQRALLLGAGWNRWPLYWDRVEPGRGVYNWSAYDRLVMDDLAHGLQINAILLGRPFFYADGGGIQGLYQPVFSDGSDTPGEGKTPNPANPWASFVHQAVMRYKPGGLLAQRGAIPQGTGITVWEAWNEPDLRMFWSASVEDYARLLKITWLTVHSADPQAKVMFGGLAYGNPDQDDWLAKVLAIFAQDPARTNYNWFIDQVAVHNYSYARRSYLVVQRVKDVLRGYGLDRTVWLNESGVPVWDDYPGPTWTANDPASRALRATMEQQANFIVQSTVYAWAAGAEVVFFHQLYDDCGNQASGTNFPPNNGNLCSATTACAGDAHGLYRNEVREACFSQHPLPGTPRPAAAAYYRLAQIFGEQDFANGSISSDEGAVIVSFRRTSTNERIAVLWNTRLSPTTASLAAVGGEGTIYSIGDEDWAITPDEDGLYQIGLQPTTRDDYPYLPAGEVSGIAGPPLLLVEKAATEPVNPALVQLDSTSVPIIVTPGSILTSPVLATIDPSLDSTPPQPSVVSLPVVSPPTFTVYWGAQDESGIALYVTWVRINGGEWQPWLETADTEGEYQGEAGNTYEFAVWAQDLAGNWSLNIELEPQAVTTVP